MLLIDKFPNEIIESDFISFWKSKSSDYSPCIKFVETKLSSIEKKLVHDKMWYSITGCSCIINTKYLKKLIEMDYDKIYGLTKHEAVGTEILFGYFISNVLNIENKSLFDFSLEHYIRGIVEYKYIKKNGGGQNYIAIDKICDLNNNVILNRILNKTIFTDLSNCNTVYKDLIKIIDTQEFDNFQSFLIHYVSVYILKPF
jgi:hypothetical protein